MSSPETMSPDLDTLVRSVTQRVLSVLGPHLGAGASMGATSDAEAKGELADVALGPADQGNRLGWLLASPLGHALALLREMAILDRLGQAQWILCVPEAAAGLRAAGGLAGLSRATMLLTGEAGKEGSTGELGGASAWLRAASECDLLYVGALGWHQARAVVDLDDRDPAVAVVLDALAAGRTVRLLTGEDLTGLHRLAGEGADGAGREGHAVTRRALGSEAARLRRSLSALGLDTLGLDAIGGLLKARAAVASSSVRALGGLLTEKDVEQAAQEGRLELRLPRATVVTPLARDRARALGIVIRREA